MYGISSSQPMQLQLGPRVSWSVSCKSSGGSELLSSRLNQYSSLRIRQISKKSWNARAGVSI